MPVQCSMCVHVVFVPARDDIAVQMYLYNLGQHSCTNVSVPIFLMIWMTRRSSL